MAPEEVALAAGAAAAVVGLVAAALRAAHFAAAAAVAALGAVGPALALQEEQVVDQDQTWSGSSFTELLRLSTSSFAKE